MATKQLASAKTPFEIADLISFYQSDNVMPKGELEEIAKAASLASYMWQNRQKFRTQTHCFKPPEDTIFRPVAPFNVFSSQEGSEYLTNNKLLAPTDGFGNVQTASSFTMLDEETAKQKAKSRKMTVHMKSGSNHTFKLRLKLDDFSLDMVKDHLSKAGISNFMLGIPDKKQKKKDHTTISTEKDFQKQLRQSWKQKRILELAILTSKRKRRSTKPAGYDNYENPRKKVKKEAGTSLLQASRRKKREKKPSRKLLNAHLDQGYAEPAYQEPPQRYTPPQETIIEEEEPAEALYQVEMILDDRFNGTLKRQEWLVKWEGYSVEESTWEPIENLEGNVKFADYMEQKESSKKKLLENQGGSVTDVWF